MYLGSEDQGKLHRRVNKSMLDLEGFSQMVRGRKSIRKEDQKEQRHLSRTSMAKLGVGITDVQERSGEK